ncbi:MAG: hypothetical protein ABH822_00890 [Patescibacteria group bacterium]
MLLLVLFIAMSVQIWESRKVIDSNNQQATSVAINPDGTGTGVIRFKFQVDDPERFNCAVLEALNSRLGAGAVSDGPKIDLGDIEPLQPLPPHEDASAKQNE